ncbi:MAG: YidC/Oxa1 family membrane protein insertase, partial [Tannerella sp.]|nr:YidC/Oxa1 family membrane protein insertase [Tannerella sp.]
TQKRLKPKLDKIKAVFKGDEQYLILSTYYRQNHYHPIYALRSTFSLLIQIPFFIAAYSYLSSLEALKGASFLFIQDLGAPDRLASIGSFTINALPIAMTLINIVAGVIYTKGFPLKEKIQLFGMAAVFLVLLYNSPAGLVLYWTLNNVFSLIKNCLQKTRHSKKILYYAILVLVTGFDIYILFFHGGLFIKRLLIAAVCTIFLVLVVLVKYITKLYRYIISNIDFQATVLWHTRTFIAAIVSLFLLMGMVIPGSLIASSVGEFAFIEPYLSPFPFVGITLLQGASFFLFWCSVIYVFFSKKIKIVLTAFLSLLSIVALINTFAFPGDYGFLTPTLKFSNTSAFSSQKILAIVNIFVLIGGGGGVVCIILLLSKWKAIFQSIQIIIIISLAVLGIGNLVKIHLEFSNLAVAKVEFQQNSTPNPVYHLSKNGKNVIVIMLDRAISGYVPYIFDERPDLRTSFSDFTWYPNCVSLGGYTLVGLPALFGGYEYSPEEMQRQNTELLVKKYNEALLVLPKLFSENGFSVTVTDPSRANFGIEPDLSIYDAYPNVHAENLNGRFSAYWLKSHPEIQILSLADLLKNNLMHFAFFRTMPVFLREVLYDQGEWLVTTSFTIGNSETTQFTLDNYVLLDVLPEITIVDDDSSNTYTALVNELTHEPAFFQVPEYIPSNNITNKGAGPFAEEDSYHVNMAALLLLGKWFDYFKQMDVYDNTRIIIVSDHGWHINTSLDDFILPNGTHLVGFNPMLLVKDFRDTTQPEVSELKTDNTFMTHADVPYLASRDITDPINPFTRKPLLFDKSDGVIITTANTWEAPDPTKYTWKIGKDQWLYVHDNIFDPTNWEKVEK